MFHGDLRHTGLSPYDTSHVDGTEKWSFETGGGIESSPAIGADGTVYFGSHDGYFYALNPDGTEKWRFDAGPPSYDERWDVSKAIMASPAIASDGTVYIYSSANYLFAINPDGSEKWRFYLKWNNDFWSCPAIGPDGTIYIGSARSQDDPDFDGGLHAINTDGTEKWLFLDDSGVTSSAAIGDDGTIYFGGNEANPHGEGNIGVLYALNPDGTEKWRYKTPDAFEGVISSAAIGADGTIYVGSNSGNFYAFNPDGTVKWTFETSGSGIVTSPAIDWDGTIYFGSWNQKLYAIDGSS
jgi:outer membrane protein assembly factor BamB